MEHVTSGLSGQTYRVGRALPGLGDGFYRGFVGTQEVTLQIAIAGTADVAVLRAAAALLERLNHPRIARLGDQGDSGNAYFLVLDGPAERPLAELIHETDLSATAALEIVLQVADILEALHAAGIAWGWARPQAFWVDKAGALKLVDLRGAGAAVLNRPLTLAEATYLAPEFGTGQPPTPSGDLYACGVLVYELLAGAPPFVGASATELAVQHIAETPPDLASVRPDLPADLIELVNRCLAKQPDARPKNAAELRADLAAIFDRLAEQERARMIICPRCQGSVLPAQRCPLCNAPLVMPDPPSQQRRRLLPLVGIAAAGLALLCALLGLVGGGEDDLAAAVPSSAPVATGDARAGEPTSIPTPLPTATAAAARQGSIVATPDNVADPNIDLIRARAYTAADTVVMELEVAGQIGGSSRDATYQVFFDGDGDPSTGDDSVPWRALGADYTVLYRNGDESAMALRWDGAAWQGIGAATTEISGGRLVVHVPAEWLGEPTQLRYGVLTTNPAVNLADYAPARDGVATAETK